MICYYRACRLYYYRSIMIMIVNYMTLLLLRHVLIHRIG